ncbi:MAG: V-type ATPase subunit [Candidatus Asgardarchaeia archaeon]
MENYVITRAHAMYTKLLPKNVIEGLAAARSLSDIATLLMPTEYGKKLVRGKELTESELIQAFLNVFEDRVTILMQGSEGYLKEFIEAYFDKYVIDVISSIVKHKLTDTPIELKELHIPFAERYNFVKNLVAVKKIEEIQDILRGTPFELSSEIIDELKRTKNPLILDCFYKKRYYKNLLSKINKMPREDREIVRRIILTYVDVDNIFFAIAPFVYGYSKDIAKRCFIEPQYRVPLNMLMQVINAKSEKQIRDALEGYRFVVKHILEKNETLAEVEKYRYVKRNVLKQLLPAFISPTYLFCYITLAEFEFMDLRFIVYATRYTIPAAEKIAHLITII